MTEIHLKKVAAGISSLAELKEVHQERAKLIFEQEGRRMSFSYTRTRPVRWEELIDGGSIYWVLQKEIVARQSLFGFDSWVRNDGTACWRINISPEVTDLVPKSHNYFQGWRYMKPVDCPEDLKRPDDSAQMPAEMAIELKKLGLI
jgi:hypothetical protein